MTTRRRALLIGGAVLLAVILVAGTWVAALRFQSPAQRAAQAQPPAAQPILVDITRGDLTETTTMTATVSAATPRSVILPLPQGTAVVTAAGAEAGSSLSSGQAIVWVNDRPVIALAGPFPLYRDLGPGDEGADVRALQQALAGLGYGVRADGQFGPATARAVRQLYKRVGASVPTRAAGESAPSGQPGQAGQLESASAASGQAGAQPAPGSETQPTGQAVSQAQASTGVGSQAATQVYVPVSEVLMLASLPAHVDSVPAVGSVLTPGNATLSLSDGALQLSTRLTGAMALRVSGGMTATATLGGQSIPVTVSAVDAASLETDPATAAADGGRSAASDAASGTGSDAAPDSAADPAAPAGALAAATDKTVILTPISGTLPEVWKGATNVLITLDLTPPLTGVLTVPQRALAAAADGSASLLIHQPDGSFTQVPVTQTSCVAGTCAIEEDTAGGVVEGAQVRVDR